MKRILSFVPVLFIVLPFYVSAQSFRISNLPAWSYTYDKFSNEIYYTDSQGTLWIKNLNDSTERLGPFPSIPSFAHNENQCVYLAGDSLIIHNFDNNTDYFVYSSPNPYYNYNYIFSPNDEYLLFYLHYFSFADSSVHEMNFSPDYEFEYDWIDETEVIYVDNENYMFSYNFVTNIADTLFVSPLY
ncbi:MAG TPA: hypothetical protein VLB50_11695, partial [Ignavibacteriaceae bacterium]|nr:hypothetical protein [Ignavibacteriaceae bacterium]